MLPRLEMSPVVVAVAIRQGAFHGTLADVVPGIALLNMALSLLLTPLLLKFGFHLEPEGERHHPPIRPDKPIVP